jgi:hypothetical protein
MLPDNYSSGLCPGSGMFQNLERTFVFSYFLGKDLMSQDLHKAASANTKPTATPTRRTPWLLSLIGATTFGIPAIQRTNSNRPLVVYQNQMFPNFLQRRFLFFGKPCAFNFASRYSRSLRPSMAELKAFCDGLSDEAGYFGEIHTKTHPC